MGESGLNRLGYADKTRTGGGATVVDAFAGIGGFSVAFSSHGFRTLAFAETDAFCSRVLNTTGKMWQSTVLYGPYSHLPAVAGIRSVAAVAELARGRP